MSKRAFFVIGPEGSGTNLLAEALVSAGCYEDPRHRSYMDDYEFEKMPDLFMFRRSLPHAGKWPHIHILAGKMMGAGFDVEALLILRDYYCTIQSVMRRDPKRNPREIELNMQSVIRDIGWQMPDVMYVSYESFCLHPEFRRWLFVEKLGLKEPTIEIKYANPKYYEHELTGIKGGLS